MVDNLSAELAKYKWRQTSLRTEANTSLVEEVMKGERARVGRNIRGGRKGPANLRRLKGGEENEKIYVDDRAREQR